MRARVLSLLPDGVDADPRPHGHLRGLFDSASRNLRKAQASVTPEGNGLARGSPAIPTRYARSYGTVQQGPVERQKAQIVLP